MESVPYEIIDRATKYGIEHTPTVYTEPVASRINQAYVDGATEQRDIDIERVWNYFETAVCHWVEENDLPKAKEQFIKYMKGE